MPLESPNKPADLNRNWPLSTDPIAVGDAHLRAIKKVLKGTVLGNFADRSAFTSFYTASSAEINPGCIFFLENRLWCLVTKSGYVPSVDGPDSFDLTGSLAAIAVTNLQTAGYFNSQNTDGLAVINSFERRRPLVRYVNILTGTDFDVAQANAAFPNGTPVANDVCFQIVPGASSQNFLRFYTGSSWSPLDMEMYNRVAAYGFLSAQALLALSVDTDRVRTRRQEIVSDTKMYIVDPEGFGPDELCIWYGNKAGLVGTDGEIFYNSLTITNAIRYETVLGQTGSGGEAPTPPPTPPTDATVLTDLGTLGITYSKLVERYNSSTANAEVGVSFNTNGTFSITGGGMIDGTPLSGDYLSDTTAGIGAQFEVKFEAADSVRLLGTLDTWQILDQVRSVSVYATASGGGGATQSTVKAVTITVRKVGLSATEQSKVVTLDAEATSNSGAIP